MAISFATASTVASAADAASASLAWPAGIVANDAVLVCLALGSVTPTPADPAGFTLARAGLDAASSTLRGRVWVHPCTGSESGTIALTWSGGSASYAAVALRYRYVDATTPIDVTSGTASSTAGTARGTLTASPAVRNVPSVQFWLDVQGTGVQSWALASQLTQRAVAAASASASARFVSVLAGDAMLPVGGGQALSGRTSTSTISSPGYIGWNLGLTPDVSGGAASSFEPHAWADTPIKLFGAPTPPSGQLWPRGVAA
jgi:hypothetical protein